MPSENGARRKHGSMGKSKSDASLVKRRPRALSDACLADGVALDGPAAPAATARSGSAKCAEGAGAKPRKYWSGVKQVADLISRTPSTRAVDVLIDRHFSKQDSMLSPVFHGRAMSFADVDEVSDIRWRTRLAGYYVNDAVQGHLDNGLASNFASGSRRKFLCCIVQTHRLWNDFLYLACVAHSLLIFVEPPPAVRLPRRFFNHTRTNLVEVCCVAVYLADIWMKLTYMGWKTYFGGLSESFLGKKSWQRIFAILTVLFAVETALSPAVRLTRPLRPILLVLRARVVRNFFTTMVRIAPELLKIMLLLLFFLFAFSLVLARLVRSAGDAPVLCATTVSTFKQLAELLLTQDNYQDLLGELWLRSAWAVGLFFVVVVVGVLFLMQLLLGTVFDQYVEEANEDGQNKRVKQAKGLMRAFKVLDADKTGKVGHAALELLLARLKPQDTELVRSLKVVLLTRSNCHESGQLAVDPVDFLHLVSVSDFEFEERSTEYWQQLHDRRSASTSLLGLCVRKAKELLASERYLNIHRIIVSLDALVFLFDLEGRPVGLRHLSSDDALQGLFLVHVLLLVLAESGPLACWHRGSTDARLVLAIAGVLAPRGLLGWSREASTALGAVRALQLVTLSPALMRSVMCTLSILPSVMMMTLFVFVVHYFFSVLALEILGSRVASFSTVPNAFATMLQILLEVDLKDTVAEAVAATHPAVSAIFLAYYALAVMVVLNLITALMIEFYRERLTQAVEDTEQKRADLARTVQTHFHGNFVKKCLLNGRQLTAQEELLRQDFLEAQNAFDEQLLSRASAEFKSKRSEDDKAASVCLLSLHRQKSKVICDWRGSCDASSPDRPRAKSSVMSMFSAVGRTSFFSAPES